jgi:alpha-tubulin suppressor-like RCC1 family protein
MWKKKKSLARMIARMAGMWAVFASATPQIMRIEGSLFDSSGVPYTGSKDIRVKAYDAATAGTLLWTSSVSNTSVSNGRYSLALDATTGSPTLVERIGARTAGQSIYFEIEVDTGAANGVMNSAVAVAPRISGKGQAFALSAASADSITGVTSTVAEMNRLAGVTGNIQTQLQSYWGQYCSTNEYLKGFDLTGAKMCASLPGSQTFTKISWGAIFQCALVSDTTVMCWGNNGNGQLGNGSQTASAVPVYVRNVDGSKLSGVIGIAAAYQHACALKADGTVWCWGHNGYGNTGIGNANTPQLAPVQVANLTSVTQIGAAYYNTCARRSDGTAWCWGFNDSYQVGDGGAASPRYSPTQVAGLTTAVQISTGTYSSCAVLASGVARCWGAGAYGSLGTGTNVARSTPTPVVDTNGSGELSGVTYIQADGGHASYAASACAVKSNGTVYCWGYNSYGQLGNNSTTPSWSPVQVSGITSAVKVVVSLAHACASTSDGYAKCWGYGGSGALGSGNTTTYYTPVTVVGTSGTGALTSVTDISTSAGILAGNYGVSVIAGGVAYSWGDNSYSQFGNNNTTASYSPRGVQGP